MFDLESFFTDFSIRLENKDTNFSLTNQGLEGEIDDLKRKISSIFEASSVDFRNGTDSLIHRLLLIHPYHSKQLHCVACKTLSGKSYYDYQKIDSPNVSKQMKLVADTRYRTFDIVRKTGELLRSSPHVMFFCYRTGTSTNLETIFLE